MVTKQVQDALNILGLNLMFSEEQLKKSYRKSANEWHPDKGKDPTGEKMKAINLAYELLTDFLKNKDKYTIHTTHTTQQGTAPRRRRSNAVNQFELNKRQAVIILKSYIDHVNKLANHELADAIRVYANKMRESVAYYELKIHQCMSELELIQIYDEAERVLSSHLRIVYNAFINKYPYIKETGFVPNYDLNLTKFVEQLDNTLNIVGTNLLRNIMGKIKDTYGYNASYKDLREIVAKKANDLVNSILVNPTTKNQQIDGFFKEVEALFKEDYELKKRQRDYKQISDLIGEVGSIILRQRLDKIDIKNEYFYDEINYLKDEIRSIKNSTYVSKIRKYLLERYTDAINKPENLNRAADISSLLNSALEVLDRYKDGFITYDVVSFLYTVNFEDLEQDARIIAYVANRFGIPNIGYVYMTTNEYSSISSFANLTYGDNGYNFMYKGIYGSGVLHPETAVDLAEDFISVSKFLANAVFVGKRGKTTGGTNMYILYEYDGKMIAMNDRGLVMSINSDRIVERDDKVFTVLEVFRDKKRVIDKISERVINDYKEEKKYRSK